MKAETIHQQSSFEVKSDLKTLSKKSEESIVAQNKKEEVKNPFGRNEVTKEQAQEIAHKLQEQAQPSTLRFIVKDLTRVSRHNVIIEIVNERNEVVARIPDEVMSQMRLSLHQKQSFNALVSDQVV